MSSCLLGCGLNQSIFPLHHTSHIFISRPNASVSSSWTWPYYYNAPPLISVWLPKEKKLTHKGNSSFSHTLLEWQVGTACLCFSGGSILPRKKLKTDCAPYSKCLYSPRKTLFIQHCETHYYFPPHLACPLHDQSHMKISDKIRHSGKTRHSGLEWMPEVPM